MDATKIAFIGSAINFVVEYGVPAAVNILNQIEHYSTKELTADELVKLDELVREPESYFNQDEDAGG